MYAFLLLALITFSEATIGVFVKLTGDAIPIRTLNFYALSFAALFLALAIPRATNEPLEFPHGNIKDTVIIGALIAAQISVFNYAMTLVPIANVVVFWSVAPFFVFIFSTLFLGEPAKKTYIFIFGLALVGIVLAKPLSGGDWFGNSVALSTGVIYAAKRISVEIVAVVQLHIHQLAPQGAAVNVDLLEQIQPVQQHVVRRGRLRSFLCAAVRYASIAVSASVMA